MTPPPRPSWYQRFMQNLPPIPDGAMALLFMAALVGVGLLLGSILSDVGNNHQLRQRLQQAIEAPPPRPAVEAEDVARRLGYLELELKVLAVQVRRLEHILATERPTPPGKE